MNFLNTMLSEFKAPDSKELEIDDEVPNSDDSLLKIISRSNERLDFCYDKAGPSALIDNESLWNVIAQLKYKGIKLRLITDITKENVTYCKTMMRYFDVHHVDGVKGNFGISDQNEYVGNIMPRGKSDYQLICIDVKPFVVLQQYLFDILWNRAIAAKEKIKEIELGLDKEFLETVKDPQEIKKIILNLLNSATYEILILFSTANSFYRSENEGILHALKDATKRGLSVRLLVHGEDDAVKEISEKKLKERGKQIHIQYMQNPLQTNVIMLIIDQTISLAIDIADDTKNEFAESIDKAIFSNIESNVSSSASVFESYWIRSELDKQNKIKQVYFQAFKGHSWKDEVYQKKWRNTTDQDKMD